MTEHIAALVGCMLLGLGAFGLTSSSNLVKQLVSIEVAFNGMILLVAVSLCSRLDIAALLLILLAAISTGKTAVLLLLILIRYGHERSLSTSGERT